MRERPVGQQRGHGGRGQAVCFGIAHGYQVWKNVVVIRVLGALCGLLFPWRKTNRRALLSKLTTSPPGRGGDVRVRGTSSTNAP